LPARTRPATTQCRLCAAQAAQKFLLDALANRSKFRRATSPA
jgi:hypothetical protein